MEHACLVSAKIKSFSFSYKDLYTDNESFNSLFHLEFGSSLLSIPARLYEMIALGMLLLNCS